MKNHFTITITDSEKGVKQINLNQFIKKTLIYSSLFLIVFIFIAVATIIYLQHNVETIQQKKKELNNAYETLESKNKQLQSKLQTLNKQLIEKKEELQEVSDSIQHIQTLLGLTPTKEMNLKEKVDLTKITSQTMATVLQFIPNGSPIPYKGITGKFGYRIHPITKEQEFHPGLDMKAKRGTPVYATADGIVEYAGYHGSSGYGNLIIIDNNYGFKTYFGHLQKIKIRSGSFVKKGQLIALTGNTGLSNGPHLHYEVRFLSRPLNPKYFINWNIKNFNEIFQKEKKVPWQSLLKVLANIKVTKPTQVPQLSQPAQK